MLVKLKKRIVEMYHNQRKFALDCGKKDDWISRIIYGTRGISAAEKEMIQRKLSIPVEDIDSYFDHSLERPLPSKTPTRASVVARFVNPFITFIKCPICSYEYSTIVRPFKRDEKIDRWQKDVVKGIIWDGNQENEGECWVLCLDCYNNKTREHTVSQIHIFGLVTQEILEYGHPLICDECGANLNKAKE